MWATITSIIAGLLERAGLSWWREHKQNEACNAQDKVAAESDSVVDEQLRTEFTRK